MAQKLIEILYTAMFLQFNQTRYIFHKYRQNNMNARKGLITLPEVIFWTTRLVLSQNNLVLVEIKMAHSCTYNII